MSKQSQSKENRRWLPVIVSCLILIGSATWASVLLPESKADNPQKAQTAKEALPYLGLWNGKLARFDGIHSEPVEVYEVTVAALPEEEQRRLEEGIVLENEETLAELLDSYTS